MAEGMKMTENIQVFRQNHICIRFGNRIIHTDPFMSDFSPRNADFILITHDHHDHFSLKDIEKTANKNTVLIYPEDMRKKAAEAEKYVGKTFSVKPCESRNIEGLEFETVPSYNIGKPFHPKSAGWVGYILKIDGKRIYIAGDTDDTKEAEQVKCDIALVPIGGTYTMNALQAAEFINIIKPEIAIPVHYGGIVGSIKDGETFEKAVDKDIKVEFKIKFR